MRHLAKWNVPLYLRNKRLTKQRKRILKRKIYAGNDSKAVSKAFGASSKIMTMLKSGAIKPFKVVNRKGHINFIGPKNFSILSNPEESLRAIAGLASVLMQGKVHSVHLDLDQTKEYDVTTNCLLDILVTEFSQMNKTRKIRWTGAFPRSASLRRMVRALGVVKFLEISHEALKSGEARKVETFETRCRHYVRSVRPREADKKSTTAAKFADHVNNCLQRANMTLTDNARHLLCSYVTEILDNAEEHSGMHDWVVQSYLDTHDKEWTCEISIINFGNSISQTMSNIPRDGYTYGRIVPYLLKHERSFYTGRWRKNELLTLIALQESVSSKNLTPEHTRGNGTVDLIRFFQEFEKAQTGLETSNSVLTLISGSSRIHFDGKYQMKTNKNGLGVIAFNRDNDLHNLPDSDYVRGLTGCDFPGTILAIRFPISHMDGNVAGLKECTNE